MRPMLKGTLHRWIQKAADAIVRRMSDSLSGKVSAEVANRLVLHALAQGGFRKKSPRQLFSDTSDDFWYWINTEGLRSSSTLQTLLPAMPDEKVQFLFTGAAGDTTLAEGYRAYEVFKHAFETYVGELGPDNQVLDFGCGWGRIIRFFLKDVDGPNLQGIDCYDEMVNICRHTNRWCRFSHVAPRPPAELPAEHFDLIYSYSVFSHLAEDIHLEWLAEFRRLLKPGGLFIATTRPREFIQTFDANLRALPSWWSRPDEPVFPDPITELERYDRGEYCYRPIGGNGPLDRSFFGETCISRGYVLNHWTKHFTFLDFIADRTVCPQNIVVVKK